MDARDVDAVEFGLETSEEQKASVVKPYVLLSCAMSIDGYIDDNSAKRLVLSSPEDLDRVDSERAKCDAILIGANTLRKDNPRLLVKSPDRRAARQARGLSPYPLKVTVTNNGDLDPSLLFWRSGGAKIVYCPSRAVDKVRDRLGNLADIVGLAKTPSPPAMLQDLAARGVGRVMIEGGGMIHTQFLRSGLVDEIQLAVAPFFVGDADAPRFVNPALFPNDRNNRMRLSELRAVGNIALLCYRIEAESVQTWQ